MRGEEVRRSLAVRVQLSTRAHRLLSCGNQGGSGSSGTSLLVFCPFTVTLLLPRAKLLGGAFFNGPAQEHAAVGRRAEPSPAITTNASPNKGSTLFRCSPVLGPLGQH